MPIKFLFRILGFVIFVYFTTTSTGFAKGKQKIKTVNDTYVVAHIDSTGNHGYFTVSFLRSQRFYRIETKARPSYHKLLYQSEKRHTPVTITRASQHSDIILAVRAAQAH